MRDVDRAIAETKRCDSVLRPQVREKEMHEILKYSCVDVQCDHCGDFTIGADVIAESQRLLANGCPGSEFECPPELLANLVAPAYLESLERTGSRSGRANEIVVRQASRGPVLRVAMRPICGTDTRNLSRWEDDGGYIPNEKDNS